MQLVIDKNEIWQLWEACTQIYLRHGYNLKFPSNTDPLKTYQWRYISLIYAKFLEWNFDFETSKKFIEIGVKYAKEKGLLKKGLSVLHQNNMLEVCKRELDKELSKNNSLIDRLKSEHNTFKYLASKGKPLDFTNNVRNIVNWYMSNKITSIYLTLSRTCYFAIRDLNKIDNDSRLLLPSDERLYLTKLEFCKDQHRVCEGSKILGDDWRK